MTHAHGGDPGDRDGQHEHDDCQPAQDQAGHGQAAAMLAGPPDLAAGHVTEHDRGDRGQPHGEEFGHPADHRGDGERVGPRRGRSREQGHPAAG